MKLCRIPHYINRIYTMGLYQSAQVMHYRVSSYLFARRWRAKASAHQAAHSWTQVVQAHTLDKNYVYAQQLFNRQLQKLLTIYPFFFNDYMQQDSEHLLGASISKLCIHDALIWHKDIRLAQKDSGASIYFDQSTFYGDIRITQHTQGWQEYKDIKIPWELSRLQYLIVQAFECYTLRKDTTAVIYQYIASWYEQNPFLLGVNWVCPMEVGLRVITLIWLVSLCAQAHPIPCFVVQMIHDHMIYLENNWEWYDGKTSNHYLSDLVGYLYCCWFFNLSSTDKRLVWCFAALETEIEKQVFVEGADYEGSTAYHALVLELFHHALHISGLFDHVFSEEYQKRYKAMILFYHWCSYAPGKILQIGDNDSAKVLTGIQHALFATPSEQQQSITFSKFGISFIKTEVWHVSLRHHAYDAAQPSGHFHHDSGSITLAYKGIPFIIDPGSYVYTASSQWRNMFKSAHYHSVCLLDDKDPINTTSSLFFSPIKPTIHTAAQQPRQLELYTSHELYADYNLRFHRSISIDQHSHQLSLSDWWEPINNNNFVGNHTLSWYFVLPAQASVLKYNETTYIITNGKLTMKLLTHSVSECVDSYVSDNYGSKQKSYRIKVADHCLVYKKYITTFIFSDV